MTAPARPAPFAEWLAAPLLGAGAACLWVASEWLFFVTKPSFMSVLAWPARLGVLFWVGLGLAALAALGSLVLHGAALGLQRIHSRFVAVDSVVAAVLLAVTVLLLVDNFTVTLLHFGVPSLSVPLRLGYAAAFIGLVGWLTAALGRWARAAATLGRTSYAVLAVILVAALLGLVLGHMWPGTEATGSSPASKGTGRPPSVLVIGPDGVDTSHLSAYGYARDTTPNLRRLAADSLLVENAYANAANTTGSLTSILTGKLPTTTRVVYPPDILTGRNSFEHLPGVLHRRGYYCLDLSVRSFGDPLDLNFRDGFDQVGDRLFEQRPVDVEVRRWFGEIGGYFAAAMLGRAAERLGHIFFVGTMADPYRRVTRPALGDNRDADRVRELLVEIDRAAGPFFAHVHLLGTHGPRFEPAVRLFSKGVQQAVDYQDEFFDDAILEFDVALGAVLDGLRQRGRLADTIVVVYSDHGPEYRNDLPVPLVFHFPNGEHSGRLAAGGQDLDIAPTILDALGLPVPDFMEGRSLITGVPDPCRPVVAVSCSGETITGADGDLKAVYRAPFFSLGSVELRGRGFLLSLDVRSGRLSKVVDRIGDTRWAGCRVPSKVEAREYLAGLLVKGGYEITSLLGAVDPGRLSRVPQTGRGGAGLNRGQVAAVIGRAMLGGSAPPLPRGDVFADVPKDHPAAPWIELLASRGLLRGKPDGLFGPTEAFSRIHLAVVLLRLRHGSDYQPPPASGKVFADTGEAVAPWAEQLAAELGDVGCGPRDFCPEWPVSSAEVEYLVGRSLAQLTSSRKPGSA